MAYSAEDFARAANDEDTETWDDIARVACRIAAAVMRPGLIAGAAKDWIDALEVDEFEAVLRSALTDAKP